MSAPWPDPSTGLILGGDGVWHPREQLAFGYSDGTRAEDYLRRVLESAQDLSTRS